MTARNIEEINLKELINIPPNAKDWPLDKMPLSVRLAGVLDRMGLKLLGDLHGIAYEQINSMRNCGKTSILELKNLIDRVQAGEFDYVKIKGFSVENLIQLLEKSLAEIPKRERDMILHRMGGFSNKPLTLEEIGKKYGLTRERVRQVVDLMLNKLYRSGGPAVDYLLKKISEKCLENVMPLTTALLEKWLGPKKDQCKYPLGFYVRLFGNLNPDVPDWADGQKPYPNLDSRTKDIVKPSLDMLRAQISPLPLKDIYLALKEKNQPINLNAGEFLRAIRQAASIIVEYPEPDKPVARLANLRIHDWVYRVLAQSDRPLKPEEIISAAKKIFGDDVPKISVGGLRNSLKPEQGVFLLDKRAFGLTKHIKLPEKMWEKARNDAYEFIKAEKRPMSTREIIKKEEFLWAKFTNPHEIAHILRGDPRLVDQGRFLFALKEWGESSKRVHIKDLIPQILKATGHPMTATEILKELRKRRSVGRATISAVIKNHHGIKEFGYGYYGLKSWGEPSKEFYVTHQTLVRRILLAEGKPITFGRLCEILKVPTKGRLAERLWLTVRTMRRVNVDQEDMTPSTLIIHKVLEEKQKNKA